MAGRISRSNFKRGISFLKRNGIANTYIKVLERLQRDDSEAGYTETVKSLELSSEEVLRQRRATFENPCLISIVIPVYEPESKLFLELLESVAAQTYTNWQLCIADASEHGDMSETVRQFVLKHRLDPKGLYDSSDFRDKVKYKRIEKNRGISANTNEAIKLATGSYIAFADHDDILTQDALFEVVSCINRKNQKGQDKNGKYPMFIYSDEDKVSYNNSSYFDHHIKFDYDPAMLLTNNYICHLMVAEAELVRKVGGLDSDYDGSQDFDFALKCTECLSDEDIVHIPKVLYHWRSSKSSTAENPDAKLYAYEAGQRAISAHLNRIGISADVNLTSHLGFFSIDFNGEEKTLKRMSQKEYESLNEEALGAIDADYILVMSDSIDAMQDADKKLMGALALDFAGATTGCIIKGRKIESAGYYANKSGGVFPWFAGLNKNFSGYLHRAKLLRCVDAFDSGCVMYKKSALRWNGDGAVLADGYRCVYVPEAIFKRKG